MFASAELPGKSYPNPTGGDGVTAPLDPLLVPGPSDL